MLNSREVVEFLYWSGWYDSEKSFSVLISFLASPLVGLLEFHQKFLTVRQIFFRLPAVVIGTVSFPTYKVLRDSSDSSVGQNLFHFVFFFAFYFFWRWICECGAICFCLREGSEERCVKHVVDLPSVR